MFLLSHIIITPGRNPEIAALNLAQRADGVWFARIARANNTSRWVSVELRADSTRFVLDDELRAPIALDVGCRLPKSERPDNGTSALVRKLVKRTIRNWCRENDDMDWIELQEIAAYLDEQRSLETDQDSYNTTHRC
jgi:hypothetical protein